MTKPISDMAVLIAGAGRGLGAALAWAFAREGARVVNNYRHSKAQAHALAKRRDMHWLRNWRRTPWPFGPMSPIRPKWRAWWRMWRRRWGHL